MGANIIGFSSVVLSAVGDVPVDSEAHAMTSSEDTYRGRICIRAFVGVSVRVL